MLDAVQAGLAAVDAGVYALLAYQVYRTRTRPHRVEGAAQAFSALERELRRALPSLPMGLTWREAVGEAHKLGVTADWLKVGEEVNEYEAFRYGEAPEPADFSGVLMLSKALRGSR